MTHLPKSGFCSFVNFRFDAVDRRGEVRIRAPRTSAADFRFDPNTNIGHRRSSG